jgi:cytochrome c peroxidase
MKLIFPLIFILSAEAKATDIDQYLRSKIKFFDLTPIADVAPNSNRSQVELGRRLFMDTNLSGNRNISCLTCHDPRHGTSDGLPLSQTHNGKGILRRNSLALFNVGGKFHTFMFWDGRVHYDLDSKKIQTPEPNLASEVTNVLSSALSAQALFPMVNNDEMRGTEGENEIANARTNAEAWDKILCRLKNENSENPRVKNYSQLFQESFPGTSIEKINIGHVGEAIAAFEREAFQATGSPFNQYLKGDNTAMSLKQKKGLMVFMDNNCIACHSGPELGNNTFFASVGVPQWGTLPITPDRGRGEINNETFRNYFFRTPTLTNVGLTAPYMHNGAFKTLREVINHYTDPKTSLQTFILSQADMDKLPVQTGVIKDPKILTDIFNSIQAGFLRRGIPLSEEDKDNLEEFLTNGMTDPKWKPQAAFSR